MLSFNEAQDKGPSPNEIKQTFVELRTPHVISFNPQHPGQLNYISSDLRHH